MKNTFMILWAPGPAWVLGKTVREQPYWTEHAAFMDLLFANGTGIMGGPFTDGTGSLVLVEAEEEWPASMIIFVLHQCPCHPAFLKKLRSGKDIDSISWLKLRALSSHSTGLSMG